MVQSSLIFLLALSVSREALSPKTERGSNWPCHQQPWDSRWKKCPSFPACSPHSRCFNHCQRHKWSAESKGGRKICRTAHRFFCLNPVSCEWNTTLHLAGWVKEAKGKGAGRFIFIKDDARKEAILAAKENYNFFVTVASHYLIFSPFQKAPFRNPKDLARILWQGVGEGSFPEGWNRAYCILHVCPEGQGYKGNGGACLSATSPFSCHCRKEGREEDWRFLNLTSQVLAVTGHMKGLGIWQGW